MSVYDEITQAIVAELEQGVPPWVKSWSSHLPMNVVSQKEYRDINILLLWKTSQGKFTSPYWLTYRQAESLGGYIRQGEKATSICHKSAYPPQSGWLAGCGRLKDGEWLLRTDRLGRSVPAHGYTA